MADKGFWDHTVPLVLSVYAVSIFSIMWIVCIVILFSDPDQFDQIWEWIQELPLYLQIIAWVFLTPVLFGLWVWQASWAQYLKIAGFLFLLLWSFIAYSGLFDILTSD